jgi:hypothetical protein
MSVVVHVRCVVQCAVDILLDVVEMRWPVVDKRWLVPCHAMVHRSSVDDACQHIRCMLRITA